jgi:FkbM family methyltransferase
MMQTSDKTHSQPGVLIKLGRIIGTHMQGARGVDLLLRVIHHPDRRSKSCIETVAKAIPSGPKYRLSTRWFTEWTTWFYGSQDRAIHTWISAHMRPEWVAMDIGMNFGFFACLLADRCSAVHGFEPIPWLAERARANARLNGFSNLSVVESALSEKPGEAILHLPSDDDSNWGTSSLMHRSSGQSTLSVRVDTIDNYVAAECLSRLDFLKIDVEGAEHFVLFGAKRAIEQHRPAIIFEKNSESAQSAATWLRSLGYTFFDLRNVAVGDDVSLWPNDILAVHADDAGSLLKFD